MRFGYTLLDMSESASYVLSRISIRAFLSTRFSLSQGSSAFFSQGKLECGFTGRLRIWVQTSLRHPTGRALCRDSSGTFFRCHFALPGDSHPLVKRAWHVNLA